MRHSILLASLLDRLRSSGFTFKAQLTNSLPTDGLFSILSPMSSIAEKIDAIRNRCGSVRDGSNRSAILPPMKFPMEMPANTTPINEVHE